MFYITYWNDDLNMQIKIGNLNLEQEKGYTNIQIKVKGF
jgi:hypothetical protein